MDGELFFIAFLTFIIHLIATLAYAVRIAGARTGKVAVSLALFNILVLVSRTSNAIQAPLLTKRVEESILDGITIGAAGGDFRWIIAASTLATMIGAAMIPTFQRVFTKGVNAFSTYQSVPKVILRGISSSGVAHLRSSMKFPRIFDPKDLVLGSRIPLKVLIFNMVAVAIFTVGVLASIYAGYLNPELRATASQMSAVINGVATILLYIFIDPHLSIITDEVVQGEREYSFLNRSVIWLVGSRLVGTLLAQALLIPGAILVIFVAELL